MMFNSGRTRLTAFVVTVACSTVSCGGSDNPSAPSTPSMVNVAGLWTGTVQIGSVTGGECVGATLNAFIGSRQTYTLQVTQNGSALTAVATSTTTGTSTTFSDTAGTSSVAFNATSSSGTYLYGFPCTNGQRRDTQLTAATINATISGNSGSGTYAESTNVYVAGTQTGVGIMTTNASFSMTR